MSDEQRKKLVQKQMQSELELSISIADTYGFVFVPRNGGFLPIELQPKEIGDIEVESRRKIIYDHGVKRRSSSRM